ncbi:MAG: hypothetical protein QOF53_181 [Nocardioidaceae bacterium]|jgi:hypothetical protein|nr:hypothetical protein [Nocardioidaceae bacterium]
MVPKKIRDIPGQEPDRSHFIDRLFFGFGALTSIWLAWSIARASFGSSLWRLLLLVLFWLVLAYLALPRLNRILSSIYVPGYFIGRTRTSDGLLGDPLNLALRGTSEQVATAFGRAQWVLADPITLASSVRIVTSTVSGQSYPEAPVSPLLLFGRRQDAAYQQEVEGNPAQRHHLRLWRTPEGWMLPGGHRVDWLGAGTYDRRVGLSLFTLQVTHKIDADIDVERDHIVDSLTSAEPDIEVEPLVDFTTGYHSRNGGGDTVHTDGTLPIIDVSAVAADPDVSTLAHPPTGMPFQVLLPAILTLVLGPIALWSAIHNRQDLTATSEKVLLTAAIVLALAAVASAAGMLARSAFARRVLLVLASLIVLDQLGESTLADTNAALLLATYHAGVMILAVVALSSPTAADWCIR